MSNKTILAVLVLLLVLVIGTFIFLSNNQSENQIENGNENTDINNQESISQTGETKTFVLTGENFKFLMDGQEAPELIVNEGDKVIIEFTSTSGFHDWVVDEFNAATEKVNEGQSTSVEFIANKKGTFEYYCSVGQHRANGMFGNLTVN